MATGVVVGALVSAGGAGVVGGTSVNCARQHPVRISEISRPEVMILILIMIFFVWALLFFMEASALRRPPRLFRASEATPIYFTNGMLSG
jgi:hypothetical protein